MKIRTRIDKKINYIIKSNYLNDLITIKYMEVDMSS